MGDIKPLPAQYFINLMEKILEENRKNQTNEKWFCQLPTEEKAKVLETIIIKYLLLKQPKCYEITKREFWEMWLKQPHTNKE